MENVYNVSEMTDKAVEDVFKGRCIKYWRTKGNETSNHVVIEEIKKVEIKQGMVVVSDDNNQLGLSFRHATILLNHGNVKEDAGYDENMYWALDIKGL